MDTTILKDQLMEDLENYEDRVRRYCQKVEEDRPWVAEALWQASWNFRKAMLADFAYFEESVKQAKRATDPG